jgi:hypothetical protein
MYSLSQIKKGVQDPRLVKNHLLKKCWKVHSLASRQILNRKNRPIPDRDWDNLLLLDACRYDLFRDNNTLPGELEPYYSIASNTAEYVRKTFKNKKFPEIVCVTSTPKYYKPNVEDSFHDIIHVWEDNWNDEYRTVLPETMNECVRRTNENYPNKRILAHYIPPHQPFIGETGQDMPHMVQFSGDVIQQDMEDPNVWAAIRNDRYEKERVWNAYRENLELTLPAIEDILDDLQGKTVVTSDHGNVFGRLSEWKVVGHPVGRHIKPLIKVPWLIHENGGRKNIQKGQVGSKSADIDEPEIKDRLADLGYMNN